jgi:hypothetical protein
VLRKTSELDNLMFMSCDIRTSARALPLVSGAAGHLLDTC